MQTKQLKSRGDPVVQLLLTTAMDLQDLLTPNPYVELLQSARPCLPGELAREEEDGRPAQIFTNGIERPLGGLEPERALWEDSGQCHLYARTYIHLHG